MIDMYVIGINTVSVYIVPISRKQLMLEEPICDLT